MRHTSGDGFSGSEMGWPISNNVLSLLISIYKKEGKRERKREREKEKERERKKERERPSF